MIQAPTGTVSIVFTDIQGSTALWERFGEAFEPILQLHHHTIRSQMAAHSGYEVKTEGDAFMVAFASAAQALRFCAATQVALHQAPWPESLLEDPSPIAAALSTADGAFRGIRVRMGVHTGQPSVSTDAQTGRTDYLGRMVNKAARIARAGHGGQIVVSARAYDQARGALPESEVHIRDLGEHSLRDIPGRERLREVTHSSLSTRAFPPIKTLRTRRNNLVIAQDRFFGRADELSAMDSHLRDGTRLLCLTGPTGMGKRRLATEFGIRHADDLAGGVWMADLSESQDLAGVCATLARALNIGLTQPDPVAQLGNALLGRSNTLIILADLQAASPTVTQAVGSWISRAPDARFVVTSTGPLDLPEAQILPIDPLPEDAAAAMLSSRAGTMIHAEDWFSQTQGMPMCLALLAPILADGGLAEWSPPTGRLPPAAQALHSTIGAAVAALSPLDRSALGVLCAWAGGMDVQTAQAMELLEEVQSLERRGLLMRIAPHRWRVCPAVTEWMLGSMTHQEVLNAELIHGAWAVQLTRDATAKQDMLALIKEQDNLLAASIRATDRQDAEAAGIISVGLIHGLHWLGPPAAALRVANRALTLADLSAHLRAQILRLRALSQHFLGHLDDAAADLHEAGVLAQTIDDPSVAAQVYLEQGRQHDAAGAVELALAAFQSSLDAFHASEDPAGEGQAIAAMGNLAAKRGQLEEAERLYMAALAQHRRVGDPQAEGAALSNLGILITIAGRPAEARELFRDALAIHRAHADRRGEAVVLGNLGDLYLQSQEWDLAKLHLDSALLAAREMGDRHIEGCFLGSLGEVEARVGHLPQARSLMARAERLLREVGDTYELIKLICRRGHIELLGQYPERGQLCLSQAEAMFESMALSPDTKPHQAIEQLREEIKRAGVASET